MRRLRPTSPGRAARALLAGAVVLGATTLGVAVLESVVGVANASPSYLLAVVIMAVAFGIPAALATAIGSFLLYDLLFVQPTGILAVASPEEWLNLLLLLVLGVVVGQLAGLQRARAEAALLREQQARAQYAIGRALATYPTAVAALPEVIQILETETRAGGVSIALGPGASAGLAASEADPTRSKRIGPVHSVLRLLADGERFEWIGVHEPRFASAGEPDAGDAAFRVPIAAGDAERGSLWVVRRRADGAPGQGDTRVLAAAADQVGRALERDRFASEAMSAEVARRSEAAKTALLDSVSHDLRTPLATIRAAAGILRDPGLDLDAAARRERADAIDREAERLNQLVSNLLDMSRIEAGDLRARLEPFALEDVVETTLERMAPVLAGHPVTLAMSAELPPVAVDPVFIDQVLTNLLENVVQHTPEGTRIHVGAEETPQGTILLTVEDGGPGVPAAAAGGLFEKFSRVPRVGERSRRGLGLGLAVVRGLVEAMGGSVRARPSQLGGLAVDVELRSAPGPAAGDAASEPEGSRS
jgi:two-component system sensor histidine kinase KdpD